MNSLVSPFHLIWGALALLVVARPVLAAPATGLSFDAPAECGGELELISAVESRGGHFAEAQNPRPTMDVAIRKTESGFLGMFRIHDAAEVSVAREIRGATCGEVIDALAVVTAIALNPESGGASSATSANPTSDAGKAAKPDTSSPRRAEIQFKGSSAWTGDTVQVQSGPLRFDPKLAWTVYYGATLGPVPAVSVPSLGLSFHLADFVTTPDGHQRIVGPILWGRLPSRLSQWDACPRRGGRGH